MQIEPYHAIHCPNGFLQVHAPTNQLRPEMPAPSGGLSDIEKYQTKQINKLKWEKEEWKFSEEQMSHHRDVNIVGKRVYL